MPSRTTTTAAFAAGLAGGVALGRALEAPQARFARMAGSTIAAPDAAGWITDFLNAAYFRRGADARDVDDLRLAFCIVTTRWHRGGRRLRAHDVLPFHRAFGRDRFLDGGRSPRGTLDREQLLEGAARLLGPWFAGAYADDARRAWGIAFPDVGERGAYRPEDRLAAARLGPLTPPEAPAVQQTWHTYPPVEMPSAAAVVEALSAPETWPDYASEVGRFTPLRTSGLAGQTFEIEVAAGTEAGRPLYTRGYVTITRVVSGAGDEAELRDYVAELADGLRRFGRDEPPVLPDGAEPILAFDLTTHEGHFMGRGRNRLLLFESGGRAQVRAAGTWDPLPWHLEQVYRRAGRDAQHAFWGQGAVAAQSMLHQLALRLQARGGAAAARGEG
ncbi:MAG TPA: hypothetical protein VLA98_08315 [Solirubrobacteraceae bacterium]|nr:hypothetical protein [Solirubrobacteraceae bacterium]